MYRLRYRVLEAGTTVRNVTAAVAILIGSYLASTFVNASPLTHPRIEGPRTRTVIVAPAPPASLEDTTEVGPDHGPHVPRRPSPLQTL